MAEDNMSNTQESKVQEIANNIVKNNNLLEDKDLQNNLTKAKNVFRDSFGIDVPEDVIFQIGALFTLEDEHFEIIAEDFLNSFETTLNNPADKIALCQSINISNIKIEDLLTMYNKWASTVDADLADSMSQVKRNFIKKLFGTIINAIMDSEGVSKRIINIPIVLEENAILPTYANLTDAGVDVYALEEIELKPGETKIIKTGIKVEIPRGYELQVRPRSGLSAKSKLRIANAPGTIDSGYRDEIGIICENIDPKIKDIDFEYNDDGSMNIKSVEFGSSITIEKGQRIAQLVLSEVPTINFVVTTSLNMENDRNGGFGSTGA